MTFPRRTPLSLAVLACLGLIPSVVARPVPAAPLDPRIIPLPLTPIVPAAQRRCNLKTASGLGYAVLRPSAQPHPGDGDAAVIDYLGYLAATGAVFDQAQNSPLPLGQVIPGFAEGLKLAGKGAVLRLCIPAALAYGAKATGPIPANSDLIFQITMIDFGPLSTASTWLQGAGTNGAGSTPHR